MSHIAALSEFSLSITKASFDQTTGEKRIRFVGSDTDEDVFGEKMSTQLFDDFVARINSDEPLDAELKSLLKERGWSGGMPYVSISHLKSGADGKNIPADVVATYRDGTRLKGKAVMRATPLGDAVFDAIVADRNGVSPWKDKIRISIGFIDYAHAHGDFVFERKSIYDVCPMCAEPGIEKVYLKGKLVHFALTRCPANVRTTLEVEKMADDITTRDADVLSIVGEELVKELETKSTLITDVPAMVIRTDDTETIATAVSVGVEGTVTSDLPAVAVRASSKPDEEDEEEPKPNKKKVLPEEKTELDAAYAELTALLSTANSLEEVQVGFNKFGETLRQAFMSKATSKGGNDAVLKALSALSDELRSITADLSDLRAEVAVLRDERLTPAQPIEKSVASIPAPTQIRLTPSMIERGTTAPKQRAYSIAELAQMTTQM